MTCLNDNCALMASARSADQSASLGIKQMLQPGLEVSNHQLDTKDANEQAHAIFSMWTVLRMQQTSRCNKAMTGLSPGTRITLILAPAVMLKRRCALTHGQRAALWVHRCWRQVLRYHPLEMLWGL